MPAVDYPQLHDLPILGRPIFGQQWVRHIHIGKWHCSQPHLQHRVAGAVLPGQRQCQRRAEVVPGQSRFDVIYGTVDNGNTSATAGQRDDTTFVQYFCNGAGGRLLAGKAISCSLVELHHQPQLRQRQLPRRPHRLQPQRHCNATATPTATPTATSTPTPTATPRPTPTPRPHLTPRPRPTPPPRP